MNFRKGRETSPFLHVSYRPKSFEEFAAQERYEVARI